MSSNDADAAVDPWSKIAADDWKRKRKAKTDAKRDRLKPTELAEKSLELLGDLRWIAEHENADDWVYRQSLETIYNDDGDHRDESNLQRVFDHFADVCGRCEWLSDRLAWSGAEYAKQAMKLLSKVRLAITERSNRDRSEAELALRAGRTETVVRFLAGNVDRIKAFESELTDLIAEIQTVQEMDRGSQQAEAGSPPAYLTAMNDVIEGREQRDRAARQVAFQVAVIQGHEQAWNDAWEDFSPRLVAYLNGESSGPMIEALALLDGVIESVGFDDQLAGLAGDNAFRTCDNERDQIDAAVCRFVVGVWAAIRFDQKETETLVAELDGNAARVATDHVGFVRDVIEAGKLTDCDECGGQLTPSQVGRGRCCDCIARQRKTLRWFGTAIECEYRYDNKVYGDGFDAHFPEWSRWRRRLIECYGRDRTDWQLWEDWIGYAQEHRGMDEQRFKGTLRSEADSLLPPIPVVQAAAVDDLPKQRNAGQGDKPTSKPAVVRDTAKAKDIHEIERETPALDRECGDWIQASSDDMRDHYKRKHESLKTARSNGQKTDDRQFGIDNKGHRWRVDPDDAKVVWYLKKYLTINRRKPSSKSRRTYH